MLEALQKGFLGKICYLGRFGKNGLVKENVSSQVCILLCCDVKSYKVFLVPKLALLLEKIKIMP